MAVLSFANGKSKQGYWVSFFFIAHFASWTWLKCSSGLSKNFFVLSQRSHVNMKKQRFRSVFYTNLKNPCFLLNKVTSDTLFKFDRRQSYQKLCIIKMLGIEKVLLLLQPLSQDHCMVTPWNEEPSRITFPSYNYTSIHIRNMAWQKSWKKAST